MGESAVKYLLGFIFLLLMLCLSGCEAKSTTLEPVSNAQTQTTPTPKPSHKYIDLLENGTEESENLSYQGYDLVRLTKKVKVEGDSNLWENSYAILKKQGKVLAKFDGIYHPVGNATYFGLYPFLKTETKQIFISQTISRGGEHWVVDLSPDFRVIYDSVEWEVGRENFRVIDIDGDGVYEISQEILDFWGFEGLCMACSPLPNIIFKYDAKKRKYLPANHLFRDFVLEETEKNIAEKNIFNLGELLEYIYAGKEKEAWAFFEDKFPESFPAGLKGNISKKEMKEKILAVLKKQPVYQNLQRGKVN